MTAALWVIALVLALGVVILGWFGLQASLMQSRVLTAVVGQQERLMGIVQYQTQIVATMRVQGQVPLPEPDYPERRAAEETYNEVWTERPVGSG